MLRIRSKLESLEMVLRNSSVRRNTTLATIPVRIQKYKCNLYLGVETELVFTSKRVVGLYMPEIFFSFVLRVVLSLIHLVK